MLAPGGAGAFTRRGGGVPVCAHHEGDKVRVGFQQLPQRLGRGLGERPFLAARKARGAVVAPAVAGIDRHPVRAAGRLL